MTGQGVSSRSSHSWRDGTDHPLGEVVDPVPRVDLVVVEVERELRHRASGSVAVAGRRRRRPAMLPNGNAGRTRAPAGRSAPGGPSCPSGVSSTTKPDADELVAEPVGLGEVAAAPARRRGPVASASGVLVERLASHAPQREAQRRRRAPRAARRRRVPRRARRRRRACSPCVARSKSSATARGVSRSSSIAPRTRRRRLGARRARGASARRTGAETSIGVELEAARDGVEALERALGVGDRLGR